MPTMLFTSPFTLSGSATTAQGWLGDVYTGSQPNILAEIGFPSQTGRAYYWALATNTPVQIGNVAATLHKGDVTLPGTVAIFAGNRVFAGTLGLVGAFTGVTSATVQQSAHLGVRFTANSVANAGGVTARATIRYVLDPYYTSQLIGTGAVNPVFAKTTSHAFVPMGQPSVGPWTQTSEALAQIPWASRGTFIGATVVAYSATPEFPVTFGLRVNGVLSPITITVSPAAYRVFSVGGIASIGFGDLACWEVTASSWAVGSYFYGFVQTLFQPAQTTAPLPTFDPTSGQGIRIDSGAGFSAWMTTVSHAALPGWYVAGNVTGQLTAGRTFSSDPFLADRLIATPFLSPRSGAVVGAMQVIATAHTGVGFNVYFAVYEARSTAGYDLYPGTLIASAGASAISAVGPVSIATSVQLKADRLYYAAICVASGYTNVGRALRGMQSGANAMPIAYAADSGTGVYGWAAAITETGGPPLVFPVTSVEPIGEGTNVAIGYRFTS